MGRDSSDSQRQNAQDSAQCTVHIVGACTLRSQLWLDVPCPPVLLRTPVDLV